MSRTGRRVIMIVTIAVVAVLIYAGIQVGLGLCMNIELGDLRPKVLCETDHEALLEACRELSTRVTSGELEANYYRVRFWRDSEVSGFPEVIRALRPRFVTINDRGVVRVEMNTPSWSFGVYAYPEGEEEASANAWYGDRELLNGLWYYDDGYFQDPNYDKQIDTILRRCGKLHEGARRGKRG